MWKTLVLCYFLAMYAFLLLLFPLAFCCFCRLRWVSATAFFISSLICAFRAFFMFRTSYTGANICLYALSLWLNLGLLPLLVYAVCALCLRGSLSARLSAFLHFALPFYAVYLPVEVLSQPVPFPPFMLFVKPSLYVACVFSCAAVLKRACLWWHKSAFRAFLVTALLLTALSCAPAFLEAVWYYGSSAVVWGALSAVYAVACAVVCLLFAR